MEHLVRHWESNIHTGLSGYAASTHTFPGKIQ